MNAPEPRRPSYDRDGSGERTRLRDDALSIRHRAWGFDCPCADLDFVVAEYDRREPVALVEYKAGLRRQLLAEERGNLAVLARLADRADLPAFLVLYERRPYRFLVQPANDRAWAVVGPFASWITTTVLEEARYVGFLYWLRGREVPGEIVTALGILGAPYMTTKEGQTHAA